MNDVKKMNAIQVAQRFGCTVEQAKAAYAKNAVQLGEMADKAAASKNKIYRGSTETYYRQKQAEFIKLAS